MAKWTQQDDAELRRIFAGLPPAPETEPSQMVEMSRASYDMLIGANEWLAAKVTALRAELAQSRASNHDLAAERTALILEASKLCAAMAEMMAMRVK